MTIAGQLDRRIIIEQNSQTIASDGSLTDSWSTFATVWARKITTTKKEIFDQFQRIAEKHITWEIRHRSDVTVKMRINAEGEIFDIVGVQEIGRKKGLFLFTEALLS